MYSKFTVVGITDNEYKTLKSRVNVLNHEVDLNLKKIESNNNKFIKDPFNRRMSGEVKRYGCM